MTAAFNLSQLANNVNSSGQLANAGLQNSSVTVTAGTGLSGGGAVALGGSVTVNNAGVTSIAAGTGISVSASTGAVTVSSSISNGSITAPLLSGNQTGTAPIFGVRAWCNFDGTGTISSNQTIRGSGNIASVYKTGTGQYTVNINTPMPNANYAVVTNGAYSATNVLTGSDFVTASNFTTSSFNLAVHISGSGGQEDLQQIGFMVIG